MDRVLIINHDPKTLQKKIKNLAKGYLVYWDPGQDLTEANFPKDISWVALSERLIPSAGTN